MDFTVTYNHSECILSVNWLGGFCPLVEWILLSRIVVKTPKTRAFSRYVVVIIGVDFTVTYN